MSLYHVTLEAAGPGPAPTVAQLDELLELLGPDASVFGTPEVGTPRYGAEITIDTGSAWAAINYAGEIFEKAVSNASLPYWPVVRISVITDEELHAELARPSFPELVGIREIADLLEVSPQRASTLCRSSAFPEPVAELRAGPVWTADSVRRFVEDWQRQPGRPRSASAS